MKKFAIFSTFMLIFGIFTQPAFADKNFFGQLMLEIGELVIENLEASNNSYTGYIYEDVNMRVGPSKDYKVLYKLSAGVKVTVLDTSNRYWTKIRYNGRVGFVSAECVGKKKPAVTSNPKQEITPEVKQPVNANKPVIVAQNSVTHKASELLLEDISEYVLKEIDASSTEGRALGLVKKYISTGTLDKTGDMLNIAKQNLGDTVDSLYLESIIKIQQKDPDSAIEKLSLIIDDSWNNPEFFNARGYAYSLKGDWNKAQKDFDSAVKLGQNKSNSKSLRIYETNAAYAKENQ